MGELGLKLQVSFVIALALSAQVPAADIYVAQTGNCPGDGSQASPFCTIGDAADAAVDGDVIIISPGTYLETVDLQVKSLTLRGTEPENWDVVEATIIDGSNGSGNSAVIRQVPAFDDPDPTVVLRGLTVTGGHSAGIDFANTNATLRYCDIRDNNGLNGGAVFFLDNQNLSLTVDNCRITGNSATSSTCGGMAILVFALNPNVTITNTHFASNSVECDSCSLPTGGALLMWRTGQATVGNCTFEGNTDVHKGQPAEWVGGVHIVPNSIADNSALVEDCVFKRNSPGALNFDQDGILQNNYFCSNSYETFNGVEDINNVVAASCDCNQNGVDDDIDILNGTSRDDDPQDHVPDECQVVTACCVAGGCEMLQSDVCVSLCGRPKAPGVVCDDNPYCGPVIQGDFDDDGNIDLVDFAGFQETFTGSQ